jgi:hypothetical protein
MPSVTLKKLDKAHALNAMTESKFKARYASGYRPKTSSSDGVGHDVRIVFWFDN